MDPTTRSATPDRTLDVDAMSVTTDLASGQPHAVAGGRPVLVIGEALVDAVTSPATEGGAAESDTVEHVGGSPANVAFGISALEHEVDLATWVGADERGSRIQERCNEVGVRLVDGSAGADHTSLAHAHLDTTGAATYDFDITWQVPPLPQLGRYVHVHTGSIAATLEPGGTQVVEAVRAARATATISYDPNMRPSLMGSPEAVRARVEELVGLSDLVKASDEDIAWLYPGRYVPDVLRLWGTLGAVVTVVTRGGEGALLAVPGSGEVTTVPARATVVADTVGAGDSFMAGLVSGLLDAGLLGGPDGRDRLRSATLADLRPAIDRAVTTGGITVARAGAYAPTRSELHRLPRAETPSTRRYAGWSR